MVFAALSLCCKESKFFHWGFGATAARLTPYQKIGSSNLSDLMFAHSTFLTAISRPLDLCRACVETRDFGLEGARPR